MPTPSEDYHATDPAVRDFLRNWCRRHLAGQAPWRDPLAPEYRQYFFTLGQTFTAHTTWDLHRSNRAAQILATGFYRHDQAAIVTPAFSWMDLPEPIYDPLGFYSRGSASLVVPDVAFNYPRPYSRGRRHYWTGAPRKRMNR